MPGALAVGIRTERLWCVDFDGSSSIAYAKDRGLDPQDCATWRVNRDTDPSRFKLLFEPSSLQLSQAVEEGLGSASFHFSQPTGSGEQLEQFLSSGRQVIVGGVHWKSKGRYFWPDSNGPEALSAPPQSWWEAVIEMALEHEAKKPQGSKSSTSKGDWHRLDDCPICGRSWKDNAVCQLHRDGGTLRCFIGGTFAPPTGLRPGQLVPGTDWAFSRESSSGWGEFLVFVKDKPSPVIDIRRWLRDR